MSNHNPSDKLLFVSNDHRNKKSLLMNNEGKINKSLEKQLNKCGLSLDNYPIHRDAWHQFLSHINHHYEDIEQERYILERSSDISSRETMDLNKKLENAQRLAKMASWQYRSKTNDVILSNDFNVLLGLNPSNRTLKIEDLLNIMHPEDALAFKEMLLGALKTKQETDCEIRINTSEKNLIWCYLCCRPAPRHGGESRDLKGIKGTKEMDGADEIDEIEGIVMDISKRKEAEQKITDLNTRLVTTSSSSRYAGMAEVATAILHNLGNVLNSANVSIGLLNEKIHLSEFNKLLMTIDLIKNNLTSIDKFIAKDKKGKLIPQYLVSLSDVLKDEQKAFEHEISNLNIQINHIKDVIAMYQSISFSSGFLERVFLPELINNALQMCFMKMKARKFLVNKHYEAPIELETDKVKLLQILVNLIQNAMEAIIDNPPSMPPEITIATLQVENDIVISVQDNGVGIPMENQTAIFSFGFTNKPNGHGFGLHSCALFAKEMGGELQVYSAGTGKGSTFTLSLHAMQAEEEYNEFIK